MGKRLEGTAIGEFPMTGKFVGNSCSGGGFIIGASGEEELSGDGTIDIAVGSKFSL